MLMVVGVFALGLVIGVILARIIFRSKPVGALRVDYSDPDDGPYLFLELESGPDVIKQKKYVTFKVNTQSYISQK